MLGVHKGQKEPKTRNVAIFWRDQFLDPHVLPLALGDGRFVGAFRSNHLKRAVRQHRTDGSYCGQPWSKKRPDEANGQWDLQDIVPFMLDDDSTDVTFVNKLFHGCDQIVPYHLELFTVSLKLLFSRFLRTCLCAHD